MRGSQNGEISQEQYDALQREISETEEALKKLETQAEQSATALQKISATGEKLWWAVECVFFAERVLESAFILEGIMIECLSVLKYKSKFVNQKQEEYLMAENTPRIVKTHDVHLDSEYVQWLHDIKERYRGTQIKAAVKVNSEQLLFNWELGRDMVTRKSEEKWGKGIVEQLSLDLQNEFPKIKGFSARNLWNMKRWYAFYANDENICNIFNDFEKQINFSSVKLHQVGAEIRDTHQTEKLHQAGAEIDFPAFFSYVPWRHHVEIVTKCHSVEEALFYIRKTIEEGLSRNALIDYIKADLYHRAGTAVTNFAEMLPGLQGTIAQEIVKDTYDLNFITLQSGYNEEDLEDALEQNITSFLLELGTGFAFVGRQKEIIVSGKTRKIDMLFYHIGLKCYVVVELKVVSFEPEFAGKLNFYVNAVNELLKTPDENPTIGLLICKDKDQTEVQWAFQGIQTPMGVASYDNIKIEEIKKQLPSEEQIQKRLELAEEEFLLKKTE